MARNSSGTYTLPAGNPVVTATTVSTTWANTTLGDLATEITDSASRSGKGGFTAPVRTADGTVAAPAYAFTSEPATGLYKAGTGDLRFSVGGVDALKLVSGGLVALTFPSVSPLISTTGANSTVLVKGNANAADVTAVDVALQSTATRTAGFLVVVQNNGTTQLQIDYQGLLRLANTAAIQPASLWTAITPAANWTAGSGLAYWKDASGTVHLKGTLVPAAGASSFTVFTLPVGFRPAASRFFAITDNAATGQGSVDTTGVFAINSVLTTGHTYAVDGVTFLAEA